MNRDEWRWTDENGVQRLVRTDELRAALASSVLPPSTLVWREGMKEWAPAFTLPELASAAISAARAGRPGSTPPPAHAGAGDEGRDTPTDVMPLDPAPRAPGRPLPERPAPKSSAPPLPTGKRPPMRTLLGLSSPDDDRPSIPNVPIVVPAAGGQKPEAGRSPAITQLPKYGGGADPLVPTIPQAPLVPSGLPQRGRPQERKARTSDIDALWAGSPPRDDDEPTIQAALRPEKSGSSAPKPAGAAAERGGADSWGGVDGGARVEGASPSKRPPPPLPTREARAAAASARLGAGVSAKPAGPPPAAPTEARHPAKPKTLPPARPKRIDPEIVASKSPSSTRPPPLNPRDARTPATTPKPVSGRQADAAPPLVARLEGASSTLPATAKPAEIAGIKVPPPAPSSAPSLEELRSVSLKKTLAGGISAFVASGAPLPTPPAPAEEARAAPADAPAKPAAAPPGPTPDALSWPNTTTEAGPARGDAPALVASATSSAAVDAAPAPLPSSPPANMADADRPRAASERPPSLEAGTSRSERPPSLSSRPPSLSERPPSLRAEVELLTSIGRNEGASKALEQPITVPLSSLVFGVGGFVVISLVLVFFVGRCSVGSAEARPGAQKGVARASLLARSALPVPARPCSVLRNPTMWAPQASKSIPFELGANGVGLFTIGYAKSEEEAAGLTFDFESNEVKERTLPKPEGKIDRVTPLAGETPTFAVSPETPGRTLVHVPATPPFVVILEKSGIATAADPAAPPTTLWPLEGNAEPEAARVLVARDGAGYAVTFRRGGGIWTGWLGPDRKPVGNPVRVVGSGGSVGKPNPGYNGRELAVVFADKAPGARSRWEIRVGRAPKGSIPEQTKVIAMPKGGPGGDAFAPDIAGLPDGRWLLVWTEGAPGKRAVRGQTLAPDLTPIGDAVALSPPQGNFGQGVLGVVGDRAAAVFLSKGEASYELWGAILGCG